MEFGNDGTTYVMSKLLAIPETAFVQRVQAATFLFLAASALLLFAQAQPVIAQSSTARLPRAEEEVAQQIALRRRAAHLRPLKRVSATLSELQLVCTAALTGKNVKDTTDGNLFTYVTRDLSAETRILHLIALGMSGGSAGHPPYRVYSDQQSGRFSVIVMLDVSSTPETMLYRVGLARRPSRMVEFISPLTRDNPIKDSKDWKEEVTPACSKVKP